MLYQPISSPQITRIFGFFASCARAGPLPNQQARAATAIAMHGQKSCMPHAHRRHPPNRPPPKPPPPKRPKPPPSPQRSPRPSDRRRSGRRTRHQSGPSRHPRRRRTGPRRRRAPAARGRPSSCRRTRPASRPSYAAASRRRCCGRRCRRCRRSAGRRPRRGRSIGLPGARVVGRGLAARLRLAVAGLAGGLPAHRAAAGTGGRARRVVARLAGLRVVAGAPLRVLRAAVAVGRGGGAAGRGRAGLRVVALAAVHVARGALGRGEAAVGLVRGLAGLLVVVLAGRDVAGRAGAIVGVAAGIAAADIVVRVRVPLLGTRRVGIAVLAVDVGRGRAAARIAVIVGRVVVVVVVVVPGVRHRRRGQAERRAVGPPHRRIVDRLGRHPIGHGRRVPFAADPRLVVVAGAVDHHPVRRHHAAQIALRVADIDVLRRGAVDVDIGDVVQRRGRRDAVDRVGDRGRHRPRAVERRGEEPDPGLQRVEVLGCRLDDRRRRIDDVVQRGAFDRPQLRQAVDDRGELGPALQRHRGGARDRGLDHRLLGLRRAGHRRQHDPGRRSGRDLAEVGRQVLAGDEAPRPGDQGRAVPAAGGQDVELVVAAVEQHVGLGVGGPEQARGADRLEVGLAVEHDQLGRGVADVDGRQRARPVQQVDRDMLGHLFGDLVELRHRLPHPPPGPVERIGLEPAVVGVEIVRAAALARAGSPPTC